MEGAGLVHAFCPVVTATWLRDAAPRRGDDDNLAGTKRWVYNTLMAQAALRVAWGDLRSKTVSR